MTAERKRWHWILTIVWEEPNRGEQMVTATGTCAPLPGRTRQDTFDILYDRTVRDADAKDAYVLYFSLEPDDLWPTTDK
jgi:hypothetical protein